jgi:hypothetical protein
MAVAEQGTSGNDAGHYCWVYNYYVGTTNASACSESPSGWPTGADNNGDVAGYYFNDAVHTSLKHSATSTNTYNAVGQRVRDVTASATTDEAYGAGGNLLWRYTGSPYNRNQRAFERKMSGTFSLDNRRNKKERFYERGCQEKTLLRLLEAF